MDFVFGVDLVKACWGVNVVERSKLAMISSNIKCGCVKMIKKIGVALVAMSLLPLTGGAESKTQLENKKEKVEKAKAKVDVRIQLVAIQAKRIDLETEKLIKNTLALFQKVRDSDKTSTKVLRHKKQLIEGLKKNIKLYSKVQKSVNDQLSVTGVEYGKELVKFHKWLNGRITKRVAQITEMTKSFDVYKDAYDENDRDTDYRKDRQNAKKGERERGKVVKAMNESIEKIRKKISALEEEMNSMDSSKEIQVISLEIETAYKNIETLEVSIQEILSEENKTKKISREGEKNISRQLILNGQKLKTNMSNMLSHLKTIVKLAKYRAKLRYIDRKVEHKLQKK